MKYNFQKLTPTKQVDIKVYEEAIDFVFKNEDIHNVAVSGVYSAGKSSLIETYKEKHKEKKFLHLSLAHFMPTENSSFENKIESGKESVLEGKILNQLLHQIPAEKIAQTNFKVKRDVKCSQIAMTTLFVSSWFLSILRIMCAKQLKELAENLPAGYIHNMVAAIAHPYGTIVAFVIGAVCTVGLLYALIKLQKNKRIFKKINVKGNEIEIFEKQDDSYFDKYLNEVLYLFENSGADVIVFEDIDRFNSNQIFERLHEINMLVNTRRKRQHDKADKDYTPLRFFYLLRDDIFESKDRTKFFDYIIPVVPVIDSSNSYDKFLEILQESGYLEQFDLGFLQSLSLYVDDMRILKNICNEFTVYINRINTIELDWNKMMAMIAYKNLFPCDFGDLQLGRGFVYDLFNNKKKELVSERLSELRTSQETIKDDIAYLDERVLCSLQELEDAKQKATERYSKNYHMYTVEESKEQKRYLDDFEKRKTKIQTMDNADRGELVRKLEQVEFQISHTETGHLKDLITRENIELLFEPVQDKKGESQDPFYGIKTSNYIDLVKFLIRNGYIDETYTDYISYFYENSISTNDKRFLRRITDQLGAEYAYHLDAPEKVAECAVLRNVEFEQEETLNFDLLNYLLEHLDESKYTEYVNVLIGQLKEKQKKDFISKYYDLNKARKQFVVKLNEQWSGFFKTALQAPEFTGKQLKQYSLDTLYYSDSDVIKEVDADHCLCQYISQTTEYLSIRDPDSEKLITGFELLGVSIEKLTDSGVDPILLNEVYSKNLYVLNFGNIAFFLRKKYIIIDEDAIVHRNFTLVSSRQEEPLYQYVMANLPVYVSVMLENCGNSICDTEEAAVHFLNQETVEEGQKVQYISNLTTKISELSKIDDIALWPQLLEKEKIEFSADNMLYFFIKHGLTTILIGYINQLPPICDFSGIEEKFKIEQRKKLFVEVSYCKEIANTQYKAVLLGLGFPFTDYNGSEITDDKFDVLIQVGILQMNLQTLQFVRDKYSQHRFKFIEYNLDAYLELLSENPPDYDEVEEILNWKIPDEKKLKLLSFTNKAISVVRKSYSDRIIAYILEHNYESDDFDVLCQKFSQYEAETQVQIRRKAIENEYDIYRKDIILDEVLLSELLKSQYVERQHKICFFVNGIPNMNEETCQKHFKELNLEKMCHIFDRQGGRYNYEKTDETTEILEGLKKNGWIYEYKIDDRNAKTYNVTKNPPHRNRN